MIAEVWSWEGGGWVGGRPGGSVGVSVGPVGCNLCLSRSQVQSPGGGWRREQPQGRKHAEERRLFGKRFVGLNWGISTNSSQVVDFVVSQLFSQVWDINRSCEVSLSMNHFWSLTTEEAGDLFQNVKKNNPHPRLRKPCDAKLIWNQNLLQTGWVLTLVASG